MYTHPFFEATPPDAAPGPPVNTGARVPHSGAPLAERPPLPFPKLQW
jgi:hypothetical protein